MLHYPDWAFATDRTKPTIIVPKGITIGQRVSISDVCIIKVVLKEGIDYVNTALFFYAILIKIDALEINLRYNCTAFLG